jgi:hypothetical protein
MFSTTLSTATPVVLLLLKLVLMVHLACCSRSITLQVLLASDHVSAGVTCFSASQHSGNTTLNSHKPSAETVVLMWITDVVCFIATSHR